MNKFRIWDGSKMVLINLVKDYLKIHEKCKKIDSESDIMGWAHEAFYSKGKNDPIRQDIYEKDIVKVTYLIDNGNINKLVTKVGEVVYEEDYAAFVVRWNYNKHQHHVLFSDLIKIELLGNSFENPEIQLSSGTYWGD